ncbi:hypothetical protein NPIL_196941 [Nephila pilipes]|uniref:Uncharacterized protein n=1 Tax=Nephila pilipes TaxID=299642 RepID=A0A8X6TU35_NEPPI|nr:hypothetical protein NPIL_196941 [Nephila pilipes]
MIQWLLRSKLRNEMDQLQKYKRKCCLTQPLGESFFDGRYGCLMGERAKKEKKNESMYSRLFVSSIYFFSRKVP